MDLARQILLDLEEKGAYTNWMDIDIEEYSPEQMDYHLELLTEAGLISVEMSERGRSRRLPVRLTWDGHEFLDLARDERRWQKVMGSIEQVGGVPFEICKAVLFEMARREAGEHLPLAE
jgi:DNA-binding transcriptional ArsR family regulator